jgi:membrane-associated protease RseP (regulator of RpoE activity)
MGISKTQVLAYLEPDEPDYASAVELGSDVLPVLKELLDDDRPGIAAKAASLAGMVGGDAAVAVLQKAGKSADPIVRVAAAGASSGLTATQAAKVLSPLVADQDVGVQKTALNATPVKLPSALRKAIEKIDPATADASILQLSRRTLGVEDDTEGDEPSDTFGAGFGEEMADTTLGEMPLLGMGSSDDQMPTGDMETGVDDAMTSTEGMP